jgi:AraC-like DNA-binding protein
MSSQKWGKIYREITPLTKNDCFLIFAREKNGFDFPLHTHEEIELNFIENGKGVQRIVGDNIEDIEDLELVLVGSNLPHGWFMHNCKSDKIFEFTLQFHHDLLEENFLQRNQLSHIKSLLQHSGRGIKFSRETAKLLKPKIEKLVDLQGFNSVLELLSLLHDLSIAQDTRLLSNPGFNVTTLTSRNNRIEEVFNYIHDNLGREISLSEIAELTNMSKEGFSRFFRKHTGKTFIETLNDTRLGTASRVLIETGLTITEVAHRCGFNNLSYFNRLFKRKYGCTPKQFRQKFAGKQFFI